MLIEHNVHGYAYLLSAIIAMLLTLLGAFKVIPGNVETCFLLPIFIGMTTFNLIALPSAFSELIEETKKEEKNEQ